MSNRDTYNASCTSAETARRATLATAANTLQEAINAVGVNIGANPALGVTDAHIVTIKAANMTYQVTSNAAEATKQALVQVAKDLLRSQGDSHPA